MSIEWLLDSVEAKKKVKEAKYLMASMADSKVQSKGKKRGRADSADDQKPSKASDDDGKQQPPAKKQKDGQKAKSGSLQIPVDEGCSLAGSYRVYIDDSGIIYDAALNQTNVENNNNKFYRIQVDISIGLVSTWS